MGEAFTTWDGLPVSPEPPYGAVIVVYRKGANGIEYLILHRAHHDDAGDWSWTPPSGARLPNEPLDTCARRELQEETGLRWPVIDTGMGHDNWAVYRLEVGVEQTIVLDAEHDRFEWVDLDTALARCQPPQVGESLRVINKLLAAI